MTDPKFHHSQSRRIHIRNYIVTILVVPLFTIKHKRCCTDLGRRKHLERVIHAVMIEMEGLVQLYNLPSKNNLMNTTLENVLPWNPLQ